MPYNGQGTDWSDGERRAVVYRICAEEIATAGRHGYLQRSSRRVNKKLDLAEPLSSQALSLMLRRYRDEWGEVQDQALEAYKAAEREQEVEEEERGPAAPIVVNVQPAPPPPEPLAADHPQLRKLEQKVVMLEKERRDLRKKLRVADEQAETTRVLEAVLREEVVPWEPPTPREHAPEDSEEREPVDAVAIVSDCHADHVVQPDVTLGLEDYDFNVFRARLDRYVGVLQGFATRHLQGYDFRKLWVFLLGDLVHGDIHGNKLRNHFQNSIRASLVTADAMAHAVTELEPSFPEGVHVVSVSGNHGRMTQKPSAEDPHDNLDYLVGAAMALRLQGLVEQGRVTVQLPRAWTAFVDVRDWTFALSHGHEVRGWAGFPWYGFDRREGRVKALHRRANPESAGIDYFLYGHFHTDTKRTHAASRSIHNGAWYETDAYSVQQLAVGTIPEQKLLVMRDKRRHQGHVFEIPVYLRDQDREEALRAGTWEPEIGRTSFLGNG